MSWKSIFTTGLLCIVASPAFANPTFKITAPATLNAQGNWVWNVTVAATTGTSPVAAELGFQVDTTGQAGQQLLSAVAGAPFTGLNTQNPGTQIFTWETLDASANNKPVGLQTNCATGCTSSAGGGLDQIFSAMGSFADVPTTDTQYLTITSAGPQIGRLTSSVQVLGKYALGGGAGANGRIAEITSGTNATNYNNFAGTASKTVFQGDINLNGITNDVDASAFGANWQQNVTNGWAGGDFNRDGIVNDVDASFFGSGWQGSGGSSTNVNIGGLSAAAGGASLGLSAGTVPEPATVSLIALAVLAGAGLIRRR